MDKAEELKKLAKKICPEGTQLTGETVAEILHCINTHGSFGGITYYQVEFSDNQFYHEGQPIDYNGLKAVMDDQTKFLWLSFDNLVYIPNIIVDGVNGALAFGTTFTRNDGTIDDPDYQTYSSRLIINSNNEIGFEEFKLAKWDDVLALLNRK